MIKRYDYEFKNWGADDIPCMCESPDGEWVKWEDVEVVFKIIANRLENFESDILCEFTAVQNKLYRALTGTLLIDEE